MTTEKYGHSLEFLQSIDLAGKEEEGVHKQHSLFQPWNLIYPIKDANGW